MVSGLSPPVSIGRLVSQCAEEMRIARGRGSRCASAFQASPAGPAWSACMGDPWETKTLGSMADIRLRSGCRLLFGEQTFGLHRFLHLRAGGDALVERLHVGPLRQVDVGRLGPVAEDEEVRVGNRELLAGEVVLAG